MHQNDVKGASPARRSAYQILLKFEMEKRRIDALENELLGEREISQTDRKLIKNLTSGVIRNLAYLDWIAAQIYSGKYSKLLAKTKTILRLGLYELIYLSYIPQHATVNEYVKMGKKKLGLNQSKMINAVLRNYIRFPDQYIPEEKIKSKEEQLSVRYSFPLWLVKRWANLWGPEQTEAILKKFSAIPEFDLQLNPLKTNPDKMEKILRENEIEFEKSELFQGSYKLKEMQKLITSGLLDNGIGTIQDESAHIPVHLLEISDNDVILDVCAAPGGKFGQIMQIPANNITAVAVDVDFYRLKVVRKNLERLGIPKAFLIVADGRNLPFKPVFTKILVDAPCSGLGVISKHPDIKWRRSINEIREFAQLQKQIIDHAATLLQNNGRLVYSTCTIDPLENEDVVAEFLQVHASEFELQNLPNRFRNLTENDLLRTFPHRDSMDGSFGAVFKKL